MLNARIPKAGSRDVLVGVFLHGQAGDSAEKRVGKMSLMASDLLNELPETIINVPQASFI